MFALLVSPLVFASFTLQGHDLGRFESLLALLSLSACGEIYASSVIFSSLVGCVKPLKFKGLMACRALNCIS